MGTFLGIPRWIPGSGLWLLTGRATMPTYHGAPPAPDGVFPTVVFSHGILGWCQLNTRLAADLAAQGIVVLCLEHSDGSAAIARRPGRQPILEISREGVQGRSLEAVYQQVGRSERRKLQLEHRVSECRRAAMLFREGNMGTALGGVWRGRLIGRPAIIGHSFGGATAIIVVQSGAAGEDTITSNDPRESDFCCGVGLDSLVDPVPDGLLLRKARRPLLFVNGQAGKLCSTAWWRNSRAQLEQIPGQQRSVHLATAAHLDFCDVPALFPRLLRTAGFISRNVSPDVVSHTIHMEIMAFLREHLPGLETLSIDRAGTAAEAAAAASTASAGSLPSAGTQRAPVEPLQKQAW